MNPDHSQAEDANTYLKTLLLKRLPEPGSFETAVKGVTLHRRDVSNRPEVCFNKPTFSVLVQASKRTLIGAEEYRYGAGTSLLAGVDLPNMSYMTDATPENPYLAVSINLDSHLITQLAAKMPASNPPGSIYGVAVVPTDPDILDCVTRLVELQDTPDETSVVAETIMQDLHLLLLLGPQSELLRSINAKGTHSNRVFQGINLLRKAYTQPLDVENLAKQVYMAPPTFRKHFKVVTRMSPTRYHQHLRLYEAQRLMLEEKRDATTAAFEVGYESLNQFNREYKRLFGDPPQRNVSQLR